MTESQKAAHQLLVDIQDHRLDELERNFETHVQVRTRQYNQLQEKIRKLQLSVSILGVLIFFTNMLVLVQLVFL